jgi:hypothetical protein
MITNIFGREFFTHTILSFSRWGFDAVSISDRASNNETEHQRSTEYSSKYRNHRATKS